MTFGKTAKIVIATAVAVGAVGGGIFYLSSRQPSKEVTVVPVSNVYTSYWGDSQTLDGFVTTGSLQEVRMTEGGFDKVAVKDGDTVRKGQTLVEYDNTQAELTLRADQAKINILTSQIKAYEEEIEFSHANISILKKALSSASGSTDNSGTTGGTTSPAAPSKTVKIVAEVKSLNDAYNYKADDTTLGTKENPYRFDCLKASVATTTSAAKPATVVSKDLLSSLYGTYAVFDIYGDALGEEWLARWTVDGSTLPSSLSDDWVVDAGLVFDKTGGQITGFDATALFPYGALTLTMPEDLIEKIPIGGTDAPTMTSDEIKAKIESYYDAIDDCEKKIDEAKRSLRQAQITYEKDKMTLSAGKITASIDGTVSLTGDNTTPVGEVFLRVQGASSYAVMLYVNELMLGEVNVGTEMQLMCYESGTMAPAVITEVSDAPANGYYSGGNANASTYQVTAEITDPNAQPRLGEWCQATLDGQPVDQPSDTIYLPLFLVREDDGGEYVMRADENDRLQKRYITTGKSLWGSYVEIKDGVVLEDRLAFPYGKPVKEGAPTVDADYFDGF